jgi:hypothetical protein
MMVDYGWKRRKEGKREAGYRTQPPQADRSKPTTKGKFFVDEGTQRAHQFYRIYGMLLYIATEALRDGARK